MASFLSTLTVPAGTPLNTPIKQPLITVPGTLVLLRLYVPPGPRSELYLRLSHGGVQLAPARVGTWWRIDNDTFDFPLDFPIPSGDVIFTLDGASPTANFVHAVDFELFVSPADSSPTGAGSLSLASRIAGLFGG